MDNNKSNKSKANMKTKKLSSNVKKIKKVSITSKTPKKSNTKGLKKSKVVPKSKIIKYEQIQKTVPSNNFSKKKTRKTGFLKRHKIITIIIFFSIVIIFTLLLRFLPIFDITNIEINSATKYSNEEIIENLKINQGQNIFEAFIRTKTIFFSKLPYISNIKAKINLPNKIVLNIEEKVPKYFVFDKERSRFFKVDKGGFILEESTIEAKQKEEILIYGVIFDDEVKLGNKILDIYIDKLKVYEKIEKEIKDSGITNEITKVNFENSLTSVTLNDKLNVIFPNDTQLKYKVSFLVSILDKLTDDVTGVIDMTKENPTFSSF
ncbi:MAG: FtsQ-type POTRA domain-containing protein [Clostridia bacterium]